MKLKIEYTYRNEGTGAPYWASTMFEKEYFCACANSYEEAKRQLLKRIEFVIDSKNVVPPPPEEVEVGVEEVAHVS